MNVSDALLASVRASSLEHIRPAAAALRDAVADLTGLRCAVTDNIAGKINKALLRATYGGA